MSIHMIYTNTFDDPYRFVLEEMDNFLSRIGSTRYLQKAEHTSKTLHYRRTPSWRAFILFIALSIFVYYVSSLSPYPVARLFCYVLGGYFCYMATDKYEEVRFDKSKGTVELMNSRFVEKHLLGYRRKIVTELENVVSVSVESQKVYPGTGHMVVLLLFSGMTLSLTAQCTFGNKKEHERIASEIRKFLKTSSNSDESNSQTSEQEKKEQ